MSVVSKTLSVRLCKILCSHAYVASSHTFPLWYFLASQWPNVAARHRSTSGANRFYNCSKSKQPRGAGATWERAGKKTSLGSQGSDSRGRGINSQARNRMGGEGCPGLYVH